MSLGSKKGLDLIGLVKELSGLEDQELKDIFCSDRLEKQNLSADNLTTEDLRLIAAQMLESLDRELRDESNNEQLKTSYQLTTTSPHLMMPQA